MRPPLSAIEPCTLPLSIRTRGDWASASARTPIALARGAEVNALDGLGRTPLGVALRQREQEAGHDR